MDVSKDLIDIIVTSVLGAFAVFYIKKQDTKIDKTSAELAEFKTHVATHHPSNESFEKLEDRLDAKMDKIDNKLDLMTASLMQISTRLHKPYE